MKFHLNRPLLSITFSLFALFFGIVMIVSTRYLPELQSIRAFFVLFPATSSSRAWAIFWVPCRLNPKTPSHQSSASSLEEES